MLAPSAVRPNEPASTRKLWIRTGVSSRCAAAGHGKKAFRLSKGVSNNERVTLAPIEWERGFAVIVGALMNFPRQFYRGDRSCVKPNLVLSAKSDVCTHGSLRKLAREALETERDTVMGLRNDEAVRRIQHEIDLAEARFQGRK